MTDPSVAETLLKNWGKRLSKNTTPAVPIYIGGTWRVTVARGNKRALRVVVPSKKSKAADDKNAPAAFSWSKRK